MLKFSKISAERSFTLNFFSWFWPLVFVDFEGFVWPAYLKNNRIGLMEVAFPDRREPGEVEDSDGRAQDEGVVVERLDVAADNCWGAILPVSGPEAII